MTRIICVFILVFFLGCSTEPESTPIVILYTERDPILPALPKDCCLWYSLEKLPTNPIKAQTVIVAGHGLPPYFAEHNVEHVAKSAALFQPELVVMNSCYGASLDILTALAKHTPETYVVAPAFRIYSPGFDYGDAFLNPEAKITEKIKAINTYPSYPILRWKLDLEALNALQSRVDKMSIEALKENLQRVKPPLVRLPFPSLFEPQSEILVPVPVKRFD